MGKQPFTEADLDTIIIAPGVTARTATDVQFYQWADPLVAFEISESPEQPWSLQQRVNFCNYAREAVDGWKKSHE
jgi:hypothetical protein